MPDLSLAKKELQTFAASAWVELDRVRLKSDVQDKGQTLNAGMEGTVVLCHGTDAYEVEFDEIDGDFFQISAKDLEKPA